MSGEYTIGQLPEKSVPPDDERQAKTCIQAGPACSGELVAWGYVDGTQRAACSVHESVLAQMQQAERTIIEEKHDNEKLANRRMAAWLRRKEMVDNG
jgi:hypothetical protein